MSRLTVNSAPLLFLKALASNLEGMKGQEAQVHVMKRVIERVARFDSDEVIQDGVRQDVLEVLVQLDTLPVQDHLLERVETVFNPLQSYLVQSTPDRIYDGVVALGPSHRIRIFFEKIAVKMSRVNAAGNRYYGQAETIVDWGISEFFSQPADIFNNLSYKTLYTLLPLNCIAVLQGSIPALKTQWALLDSDHPSKKWESNQRGISWKVVRPKPKKIAVQAQPSERKGRGYPQIPQRPCPPPIITAAIHR